MAVPVTAPIMVPVTAWRCALVAALFGNLMGFALPGPALADQIELRSRQAIMSYDAPDIDRLDSLIFRGGLDLRSGDSRFGGLSGLDISADGKRLTAVGDKGIWFTANLVYDSAGRLKTATNGEIKPLRGRDGKPLSGKKRTDAESLARMPDGSFVVGFERTHRLRLFGSVNGSARPVTAPPVLTTSPPNGGAEAITRLSGTNLLVLSEGLDARQGIAAGWIGKDRDWRATGLRRHSIYRPVGAATRDDGTVFMLERRWTAIGGIGTRISMVPPEAIGPGKIFEGRELAQLAPPLIADNFEGISVRRGPGGETLIYIVSDDNFNDLQRTLLLMFALAE